MENEEQKTKMETKKRGGRKKDKMNKERKKKYNIHPRKGWQDAEQLFFHLLPKIQLLKWWSRCR